MSLLLAVLVVSSFFVAFSFSFSSSCCCFLLSQSPHLNFYQQASVEADKLYRERQQARHLGHVTTNNHNAVRHSKLRPLGEVLFFFFLSSFSFSYFLSRAQNKNNKQQTTSSGDWNGSRAEPHHCTQTACGWLWVPEKPRPGGELSLPQAPAPLASQVLFFVFVLCPLPCFSLLHAHLATSLCVCVCVCVCVAITIGVELGQWVGTRQAALLLQQWPRTGVSLPSSHRS